MRNLIQFIIRFYAFFLFLLFEGLCLYLIQQNNRYHHTQIVNSTNNVVGAVYETYGGTIRYFQLKRINDSLRAENAQLRKMVMPGAVEWDTLGNAVVYTDTQRVYGFIPARVLNSTIHHMDNYVTLNRGARDGVETGMGVISPDGIVGKIVGVSQRYSKAMSMLHHDFRVSSQLKKSGVRGVVEWQGMDPSAASMVYVSEPADLTIGDTVVTTAGSTVFPEGVPIGTIRAFELRSGERFYDITLQLFTDYNRLHTAYIVTDRHEEERTLLDSITAAP